MKILYFLLLTAMLCPVVQLSGQVLAQDSLALVDIYHSTNGNGWTNKTNWLTSQPVSSWYGITVVNNRVTAIDIRSNNLTGPMPASIGNLDGLQSLQLDVNPMGGSIPASIGNLVNLQYLSIIQDQLTGPIPPSLGNLTSLTWLRLADNQLSGALPASLGNLSSLQYFYLGDNQFSGSIPASLGNLTNLVYLQLYLNQLTGSIPASLGNLVNLQDLELALNQLSGSIPASIGNLTNLSTFTVQNNRLSGEVPVFGGNSHFLNLFINDNFFTFAGMEKIAQKTVWQKQYVPQGLIHVGVSCGKLSVSVGGTPANNRYRWYNSAGTLQATIMGDSTFTPTVAGYYYVEVTNAIATQLTLHSDTTNGAALKQSVNIRICPGMFYTLPSGKQVNKTGTYSDTVKTSSGCGDSLITTLNLLVNSFTTDNKNATICAGQFYIMPSGTKINSAGIYRDTLYSTQGCDSLITVLNLSVNNLARKISNLSICLGQAYRLLSGRVVNQAGIYNDTLRTITQGCDSIITTVTLTVDTSVQQVKDSVAICPGSSGITLNAGSGANTYAWSTGSGLNAIVVTMPGLYTVMVKGANGCLANDSFRVLGLNAPVIFTNKSQVLCTGQPVLIDAGAGYQQYLWNTGSTGRSITIQSTGQYWVTVTDRYHCTATDTMQVNQTAMPPSGFLPPDTALCVNTNISIGPITGFEKYLWSTGETSASITISKPGRYILTVTDKNNCTGADTIGISSKQCSQGMYVPNAFTPNGDGDNDIFRAINQNNTQLSRFRLAVFNRWGKPIFESSDPSRGWDGKNHGTELDTGAYIWQLEYQFPGGQPTLEKGTVVLIR